MARADPSTRRIVTSSGQRLIDGRYRVLEQVGRGGMASVYRVVDQSNGRQLALKQLGGPAANRTRERHRLRFRREFHTMAGLRHPRIVEVYEYGEDRRGPYYTLELLDGEDLRDVRPLGWQRACALLRDVASALAFLHVRGLVHRDLAPRNVRCTADGRAKLIDFGVMATVGVVDDPAGTPPYIAPENLRGIPLDHRADLFGLGALAYWLLTGETAFPARRLEELEPAWRRRPARPSELDSDLPVALDELVMSLLSLAPNGRPSVAEAIDQLTVTARLPAPAEEETVEGHLASAALVGRDEELERIRRAVQRAAAGKGAPMLVSAPSGMGKSRLLREAGLEAQVAGATVAYAAGDLTDQRPYAFVRALARSLLSSSPQRATESARAEERILVRAVPELAEHLGPVGVAPSGSDPAEQRMLLQAALCDWLVRVATKRTLVILVDDVQRVDEASAAVLASLAHSAHRTRLVLVAALRLDEEVRAPAPVDKLGEVGTRMRLRGLSAGDLEQLITALFGRVANVGRLTEYLERAGGGSPLHSLELVRGLIDTGAVRPLQGSWVIADTWDEQAVPSGLAEMLDARVAALEPQTRALAELIAVHGGELELELMVSLADTDEAAVFRALDELTEAEVLVGASERFRFRHEGFREAVLRGLDPERATALHLRIGRAMRQGQVPPEREADVGWHLLYGGEEKNGAELLERAGRRLYTRQSFREARAPLEAVLRVYSRGRRNRGLVAEIRQMLLLAGCMTDRDVALRYADDAVNDLYDMSGLALAERLRRFVGRHLGLGLGVTVAFLKWLFRIGRARGPSPLWAAQNVVMSVGFAASLHSLSWNVTAVRRLLRFIAPLEAFGNRNPYAVYLLTYNLLCFPLGLFRTIRENTRRIIRILHTDRLFGSSTNEIDLRTGEAGARFMNTLIDVSEQDPSYEAELREIEALDLRYFELGGLQARIAFHRCRGEEPMAIELEREADILLVRLGSAWQMEAWLAVVSALAFGLTRDALGLKRAITRLERLVEEGFHFDAVLALTKGEYHRERRELDESLEQLEHALELAGEELRLARLPALPALAETLLVRGDLARAAEIAERGVEEASDPESGQPVNRFRSLRVLALVESARGAHRAAATRLDVAIEEAREMASPSVLGALHEARAWTAQALGDDAGLRWHATEVGRWFRPTENQVLVARAQRLDDALVAAATTERKDADEVATEVDGAAPSARPELLSGCRGHAERAERALAALVESTGASRGYLYLLRGEALELEAPRVGREPPVAIADRLRELVEAELAGEPLTVPETFQSFGSEPGQRFCAVVLATTVGRRRRVAGAAALAGDARPRMPEPALVEGLARELIDAGDVSSHGRSLGSER